MADNDINRAGDTSLRCGNSPALHFSRSFTPPQIPVSVLDEDELISRLSSLGFADSGTNQARYLLRRIGYAHLGDYLHDFPYGTLPSLKLVHQAILLDRRFQATLLEYIGLFELQFRAQYSQALAKTGGAFAHRDASNFKSQEHYAEFLGDYQRELNRQINARNAHVMKVMAKYGELPVWDAVENMTFGTLSKAYKNTRSKSVRFDVADSFGVKYDILVSWMQSIAYARNRCAHFGRLLGTTLSAPPKKIGGIALTNQHPFYLVLILEKLLNTESGFADDTSLMYSLALVRDIASLVASVPREVTSIYIPTNWKSMVTAKIIAGSSIELSPSRTISPGIIALSQAIE